VKKEGRDSEHYENSQLAITEVGGIGPAGEDIGIAYFTQKGGIRKRGTPSLLRVGRKGEKKISKSNGETGKGEERTDDGLVREGKGPPHSYERREEESRSDRSGDVLRNGRNEKMGGTVRSSVGGAGGKQVHSALDKIKGGTGRD